MMSCNIRFSSVVLWLLIHVIFSFKVNSCSANKSSNVLCLETERLTLLRFKEHLIDPSNSLMSWNVSQPDCCNWPEIVCHNRTGNVEELHLQGSMLRGEINSCLLELKHLEYLDLSYNDFGGIPIPNFFSSMLSLTYLNLSEAGFRGLIPQQLGNLSNLHYLSIRGDYYVENLHWLKNLSSLIQLDFRRVNLSAASQEWLEIMNSFPSLLELHLSDCRLAFLPSLNSVNFTSISVLDISYNVFVNANSIPNWIQSLSKLESLDFTDSGFTGSVPETLKDLCSLNKIYLSYNSLAGEISKALESVSGCNSDNLQILHLGFNEFSGSLPNSFRRLPALTSLELSSNQLVGNVPESLGTLSNLERLYLDDNMLEGVVSEAFFRNLTKLTELMASNDNLTLQVDSNCVPPFRLKSLDLSRCSVGPRFPSWLQTQHDLGYLDLSRTGISEPIPSWFWNFSSQLYFLSLSHNRISGELPSRLKAKNQRQFDLSIFLSSNKFTGPLPQISGNIIELDLSNNSFSGPMSILLCNPMSQVTGLRMLNLGGNNLSGDIPDCWKYWPNLVAIILENNHLTGIIPNSISHLTYLQSLHLRNNNLFGEVPESLRNCSWLQVLDLGFNNFDGKLPPWLGSLDNLMVLALPANKLEGGIPSRLCNLSFLQVLDISANNLSGSIPSSIKNLTAMSSVDKLFDYGIRYGDYLGSFTDNVFVVIKGREDKYGTILSLLSSIDISRNKLSGYIPREITSLSGLRFLNLSGNELTGDIPINIDNMQVLESFDLSRNQISGRIPPSMSNMHFLSYLNLSCNNLSGEIPRSTQLQSFNSSSFVGNELCGPPLTVNCSVDVIPPKVGKESRHGGDGSNVEGFYVAMVVGFLVGFWGICGPLLYSHLWRNSYYRFLNTMWCRFLCCFV